MSPATFPIRVFRSTSRSIATRPLVSVLRLRPWITRSTNTYGQRIVSTIFTNSNQYRVILEADPRLQTSLQSLSDIYLPSSVSSTPVPLATLAKFRQETAPLQVA